MCSEVSKTQKRLKQAGRGGVTRATAAPRRHAPREAWEGVPWSGATRARRGQVRPRTGPAQGGRPSVFFKDGTRGELGVMDFQNEG